MSALKSNRNTRLAALLARRGVQMQSLGAMIPGRGGRSHVSSLLNGTRPGRTAADAHRAERPLTKTWRQLRDVLSAEEFACALGFATARRRALGLPVLADAGKPAAPEEGAP